MPTWAKRVCSWTANRMENPAFHVSAVIPLALCAELTLSITRFGTPDLSASAKVTNS